MFDISFAELLLVIIVAVVFIRPKDVPTVVRTIAKVMKSLRDFSHEVKQVFDDITREAGAGEIKKTLDAEMQMIKGDDGKFYESYKIPDTLSGNVDVKKNDRPEE